MRTMNQNNDHMNAVRTEADEWIKNESSKLGVSLERWDSQTLERYYIEFVPKTIQQALKGSFYKKKFSQVTLPLEYLNFEKLPFTQPEEIKNNLNELLACPKEDIVQINMSSGTTGGPTTYVAYTKNDLEGDGSYYAECGLFSFGKGEIVFIALPYDMATVGFSIHRDVQRQGAAVLPAGKGGTYSKPERVVQAIHDLSPSVLFSTPSYAYHLFELYKAKYGEACKNIRRLHVGGEGMSRAFEEKLANVWGGEVRRWYGSTEIGIIAYSCEMGNYHITAGNAYIEVIDDEGNRVERGRAGNIVLTSVGREATPIVRYQTGDIGAIGTEDCTCGRTLAVYTMLGRKVDQLKIGRGDLPISPYAIEQKLLSTIPTVAPWYEINITDKGLKIIVEKPEGDRHMLENFEKTFLAEMLDVGVFLRNIDWVQSGSLDRPTTKMKRVKDLRSINALS